MQHLVGRLARAAVGAGLLTLVVFPATAVADTTQTIDHQIAQGMFNACTGEFVFVTGTVHMVVSVQPDGTTKTFVNTNGVTATTPATGVKYASSDETRMYLTSSSDLTIIDYAKLIRATESGGLTAPDEDDLFLRTVIDTATLTFDVTTDCR